MTTRVSSVIGAACSIAMLVSSATAQLKISQVYGAGGDFGAVVNRDYVELFNPTAVPVSLDGWAIQYTTVSSGTWSSRAFDSGLVVLPGGYFLIQMTLSGVNGVDIPTPDFTPATAMPMSFNGGKVALTNTAVSITGTCPSDPAIVDFVGFGNSLSCFEGQAGAPAPSQTLAIYRLDDGCFDSDQNGSNFVTGAPSPRNSTSPTHTCGPFADVGVAVAGGTCPLSLGGTESFVVTVTNHGTATTDSVAAFQIPTNMSFVSSLPSTIPVGNIVTTAFAGMIAGESRTLTIDLTTSGTGGSPTTLATATSSLSDAGHPTAVSPSTTSCTISHASTPAARQSIERAGEDP